MCFTEARVLQCAEGHPHREFGLRATHPSQGGCCEEEEFGHETGMEEKVPCAE